MRAWLFQDHRQKKKLGDNTPWSVGWVDPEGKRRSKTIGSKSMAEKYARKIEGQLAAGTYEDISHKRWEDFRAEYESKVMAGRAQGTQELTKYAFDHFERIVRPVRMRGITSKTFADYVAKRRLERHREKGPLISVATINRELRHLRAAIRKAYRWNWITRLPEITFEKEPRKLASYVPPEHLILLYHHCEVAQLPLDQPFSAADWWRGLIMMAYMTGWRIGSLLALRREDVDLDKGTAFSRHEDNKGHRDQLVPLHPVVIDHLKRLRSLLPMVFPWNHTRSTLYKVFARIQVAAGVHPAGTKPNYGFHDLRRGFATMNADRLTPDALQVLMQHQDYQTTQRYINMARQMKPAVQNLYVPDVTKKATG